MKLATVSKDGKSVAVVILDSGMALDVAAAAGSSNDAAHLGSLVEIIEGGETAQRALEALVAKAASGELAEFQTDAADVTLQAPIPEPKKNVFCVGRNYAEHINEGNRAQKANIAITEHPVYFTKPPTSVVPPNGDILIFPSVSEAHDYEVELAVVIGKPGRNISKADAMDHVYGYTILNDVTARDVQRRHGGQYFKGKGLDGSCPIGPWIVTADEVGDPHKLSIGLKVNGEQRQDGQTSDMIFDVPTLISSLSEGLTLEAGDIIATGTPSGVGYAMEPPQFLKAGDTVVCEVSKIGALSNTVRAT